ncbi:hypothetical protein RB653_007230 [Dictyostelium firmibasis]|uniref:Uncharacterized protein n=1 Tax=Dictyostelium firmibasis TaxID=79012 RepID=A0AAN7TLF7_9MYCE
MGEYFKKTSLTKKKEIKKYIKWEDIENGEKLRSQLITATQAYKKAGEDLKQIIGEDSIIHNTFIGMKNIEKLEGDTDKDNPATTKTVELCKSLKNLTKLTGRLIRKHKVDFILIQQTKGTVLDT